MHQNKHATEVGPTVRCPYNLSHTVLLSRIQHHLVDCESVSSTWLRKRSSTFFHSFSVGSCVPKRYKPPWIHFLEKKSIAVPFSGWTKISKRRLKKERFVLWIWFYVCGCALFSPSEHAEQPEVRLVSLQLLPRLAADRGWEAHENVPGPRPLGQVQHAIE